MSPLRGDGSSHCGAAERDGVPLVAARRRKERTYPASWPRPRRGTTDAMVFSLGMRRCSRVRHVPLGIQGLRRRR